MSQLRDFGVPILGRLRGFAGGLRIFRRRPGLAAAILVILILGIGATTSAFSFLAGVMLRPLPFSEPEQLTMMWQTQPFVPQGPLSVGDFYDWRQATSFQAITVVDARNVNVRIEGGPPRSVRAGIVSGEFFDVFRVHAERGRTLTVDDDRPTAERVVVLGAELGKRGADRILIEGEPFRVVGVMPESFGHAANLGSVGLWFPLAVSRPGFEAQANRSDFSGRFLFAIGRRKPGVTLAAAEAELAAIESRLAARYPEQNGGMGVHLVDLRESLVGDRALSFWLTFIATLLVFLIAGANVANLLLVDAASRRPEMALRSALGGTRSRLVRQVLLESWLLFALAALGGAALAWLVTHEVRTHLEGNLVLLRFDIDVLVLGFVVTLASLTGIAVGLWPALEATRVAPQAVLKEAEARAPLGRAQRRLRSAFIVLEVALAFALLAGTDFAIRTYQHLAGVPPGFEPRGVHATRVSLGSTYEDLERRHAFYDQVLARLAATPGVEHAAITNTLPCNNDFSNTTFDIEGRPPYPPNEGPLIFHHFVSADYFATMGIGLERGRLFRPDADEVVINHYAAASFFPGEDPIGRRIALGNGQHERWGEIVGVVSDIRQLGLAADFVPELYLSTQIAVSPAMAIVVRGPAAAIEPAVHAVDSGIAVATVRPMTFLVDRSIGAQRSFLKVIIAAAIVALALATIGVLGVVGYTTSLRTRELGVRMALGATPASVVRLVLADGLRLVVVGLTLGLVVALVMGRLLAAKRYIPSAVDAPGFAVVALVLLAAGVLGSLAPALRAARISPALALRDEGAT